ncbi:MAG: M48 family metallopeptidase [Erysipelotrichaceae bacterium]
MEEHIFVTHRYKIRYKVLRKQVKNITMRFDKEGHFLVVCNPYVPLEKIEALLLEKVEWIVENQKKVQQRLQKHATDLERLSFLGKYYPVSAKQGQSSRLQFDGERFLVEYVEVEHIEKLLQKYLNQQAKKILTQVFHDTYVNFEADYRMALPSLKLRRMEGKWGSCMPSKAQITLNTKLIHHPLEFIEYVVLHEYAHLIQPNHSKAFYALIEKYMPDYKKRLIV